MKISKNDLITLSDNIKYLVVGKIEYNYKTYLCLVDLLNNDNIKIVQNIFDEVIIVDDKEILDVILRKMIDEVLKP